MTTEPKHTPGAMNAARALCLPPEWTEAAATIDRETQLPALLADNERLREALREYADSANWTELEAKGGVHFGHGSIEDGDPVMAYYAGGPSPWQKARAALSATERSK